jgi:hypothetical protein
MPREPRERPGLQAQRTEMSWERSAIGFFAIAALLLLRHVEPLTVERVGLAGAALLLSLLAVWFGRQRGRLARDVRPGPSHDSVRDARVEVITLGWAVAAFAAGTVVLLIR